MADLTRVIGVGIVALDQRDGMAEGAELDQAEIDREDGGGDDEPGDDPGKGRAREVGEDERDEPAGRIGEYPVHGLVDGLCTRLRRENGKPGRGQRGMSELRCHGMFPVLSGAGHGTMVQGTGAVCTSDPATDPKTRLPKLVCPSRPRTICVALRSFAMAQSVSAM